MPKVDYKGMRWKNTEAIVTKNTLHFTGCLISLFLSDYLHLCPSVYIAPSFKAASQKHRHICAPFNTTAEVYLTRKLPFLCLTYLQYCHHQIFICRAEDLWMATFLLLCSIYTTLCMKAQTHMCAHTNTCTEPRLDVFMGVFHTTI